MRSPIEEFASEPNGGNSIGYNWRRSQIGSPRPIDLVSGETASGEPVQLDDLAQSLQSSAKIIDIQRSKTNTRKLAPLSPAPAQAVGQRSIQNNNNNNTNLNLLEESRNSAYRSSLPSTSQQEGAQNLVKQQQQVSSKQQQQQQQQQQRRQQSGETLSSFESDYDLLVYLGETETEDIVDTERSLDYQDQTWRQSICGGASLAPTINDDSLSEQLLFSPQTNPDQLWRISDSDLLRNNNSSTITPFNAGNNFHLDADKSLSSTRSISNTHLAAASNPSKPNAGRATNYWPPTQLNTHLLSDQQLAQPIGSSSSRLTIGHDECDREPSLAFGGPIREEQFRGARIKANERQRMADGQFSPAKVAADARAANAAANELDKLLAEMSDSLDLDSLARFDPQRGRNQLSNQLNYPATNIVRGQQQPEQGRGKVNFEPAGGSRSSHSLPADKQVRAPDTEASSRRPTARAATVRRQEESLRPAGEVLGEKSASNELILDEYDGASRMLEQMISEQLLASKQVWEPTSGGINRVVRSAVGQKEKEAEEARRIDEAAGSSEAANSSRAPPIKSAPGGEQVDAQVENRQPVEWSRKVSTCSSSAATTVQEVMVKSEPKAANESGRPEGRKFGWRRKWSASERQQQHRQTSRQVPPEPPAVDYGDEQEVISVQPAEHLVSSENEDEQQVASTAGSQMDRMKRRTMSSMRSMRSKLSDFITSTGDESRNRKSAATDVQTDEPIRPARLSRSRQRGNPPPAPSASCADEQLAEGGAGKQRFGDPIRMAGQSIGRQIRERLSRSKSRLGKFLSPNQGERSHSADRKRAKSQPADGRDVAAIKGGHKLESPAAGEHLFEPGDIARNSELQRGQKLSKSDESFNASLDRHLAAKLDTKKKKKVEQQVAATQKSSTSSSSSSLSGLETDFNRSSRSSRRRCRRGRHNAEQSKSAQKRPSSLISIKRLSSSFRNNLPGRRTKQQQPNEPGEDLDSMRVSSSIGLPISQSASKDKQQQQQSEREKGAKRKRKRSRKRNDRAAANEHWPVKSHQVEEDPDLKGGPVLTLNSPTDQDYFGKQSHLGKSSASLLLSPERDALNEPSRSESLRSFERLSSSAVAAPRAPLPTEANTFRPASTLSRAANQPEVAEQVNAAQPVDGLQVSPQQLRAIESISPAREPEAGERGAKPTKRPGGVSPLRAKGETILGGIRSRCSELFAPHSAPINSHQLPPPPPPPAAAAAAEPSVSPPARPPRSKSRASRHRSRSLSSPSSSSSSASGSAGKRREGVASRSSENHRAAGGGSTLATVVGGRREQTAPAEPTRAAKGKTLSSFAHQLKHSAVDFFDQVVGNESKAASTGDLKKAEATKQRSAPLGGVADERDLCNWKPVIGSGTKASGPSDGSKLAPGSKDTETTPDRASTKQGDTRSRMRTTRANRSLDTDSSWESSSEELLDALEKVNEGGESWLDGEPDRGESSKGKEESVDLQPAGGEKLGEPLLPATSASDGKPGQRLQANPTNDNNNNHNHDHDSLGEPRMADKPVKRRSQEQQVSANSYPSSEQTEQISMKFNSTSAANVLAGNQSGGVGREHDNYKGRPSNSTDSKAGLKAQEQERKEGILIGQGSGRFKFNANLPTPSQVLQSIDDEKLGENRESTKTKNETAARITIQASAGESLVEGEEKEVEEKLANERTRIAKLKGSELHEKEAGNLVGEMVRPDAGNNTLLAAAEQAEVNLSAKEKLATGEGENRLSVYENVSDNEPVQRKAPTQQRAPKPPEKPARLHLMANLRRPNLPVQVPEAKLADLRRASQTEDDPNWSVGDDAGSLSSSPVARERVSWQAARAGAIEPAERQQQQQRTGEPPERPRRKLITMTSIIQDPNDALMMGTQHVQQVEDCGPIAGDGQSAAKQGKPSVSWRPKLTRGDSVFCTPPAAAGPDSTNGADEDSDSESSSSNAARANRRRLIISRLQPQQPVGAALGPSTSPPSPRLQPARKAAVVAPPTLVRGIKFPMPSEQEETNESASRPPGEAFVGRSSVRQLARNFGQQSVRQRPEVGAEGPAAAKSVQVAPPVAGAAERPAQVVASQEVSFDEEPTSRSESTWYDAKSMELLDETELAEFLSDFDRLDAEPATPSSVSLASRSEDLFVTVNESLTLDDDEAELDTQQDENDENDDDTLNDDQLNDDDDEEEEEEEEEDEDGQSDRVKAEQSMSASGSADNDSNLERQSSSGKKGNDGDCLSDANSLLLAGRSVSPVCFVPKKESLLTSELSSSGNNNNHHNNDHHSDINQINSPPEPQTTTTTTTTTKPSKIETITLSPASHSASQSSNPERISLKNSHHAEEQPNNATKNRSKEKQPVKEKLEPKLSGAKREPKMMLASSEADARTGFKAKARHRKGAEIGCSSKTELKGLSKYCKAILKISRPGKSAHSPAKSRPSKKPGEEAELAGEHYANASTCSSPPTSASSSSSSSSSSSTSSASASVCSSLANSSDEEAEEEEDEEDSVGQLDDKKLIKAAKKCSQLYEELERILAKRQTKERLRRRVEADRKSLAGGHEQEAPVESSAPVQELASAPTATDDHQVNEDLDDHDEEDDEEEEEEEEVPTSCRDDQISISSSSVSSESIPELRQRQNLQKLYNIVNEIYTSEAKFVDTLKLLNEDFRQHIMQTPGVNKSASASSFPSQMSNLAASNQSGGSNHSLIGANTNNSNLNAAQQTLPTDCVTSMLKHLPQLQALNESLLAELKLARDQWPKTQKIAHVLVKIGPFLKHYSTYIREFESMQEQFNENLRKFPLFAESCRQFESSSRSQKLTIQHHLLKPIQRIPQYRLLLQQYLHHLKPDDADYEDTVNALEVVSRVAEHANQSMNEGVNFAKLMALQAKIVGKKGDIIQPGRLFVREGELMKVCRKQIQPRWFVLLNDSLLYLTQFQSSDILYLNNELPLDDCQVTISGNNLIGHQFETEFNVCTKTRSFALIARSRQERDDWVKDLKRTIEEHQARRRSFSLVSSKLKLESNYLASTSSSLSLASASAAAAAAAPPAQELLGSKAPLWTPDSRVTMCQLCTSNFSALFRRHHCRACGRVVCSACSPNKAPLVYLKCRSARVCDQCFQQLKANIHLYYLPNVASLSAPVLLARVEGQPAMDERELRRLDEHFRTLLKSQFVRHAGLKALGTRLARNSSGASSNASRRSAPVASSALTAGNSDSCANQQQQVVAPGLAAEQRDQMMLQRPASLTIGQTVGRANDSGSLISGYLHKRRPSKTKRWKRKWFVIRDNVLYSYRAIDDVAATGTIPLLGYQADQPSERIDGFEANSLIRLRHVSHYNSLAEATNKQPKQVSSFKSSPTCELVHLFKAESVGAAERWLEAFKRSVVLQD